MATPATTGRDIRGVMAMHKSDFPLAFAAVSRYVTGNLKTAAREIRMVPPFAATLLLYRNDVTP